MNTERERHLRKACKSEVTSLALDDLLFCSITPFSLLDWEDYLSTIFWFPKCNMRCAYCYNKDVVFGKAKITTGEALTFLKKRAGKLDAVVLSGGECTLCKYLPCFAREIKALGYKIKMDSNATNPKMIREMVEDGLVDFISLDYKATAEKHQKITGQVSQKSFFLVLKHLMQVSFDFEIRTTVHRDLLDEEDLNQMIETLYGKGYSGTFYIQNYTHKLETIGDLPEQKETIDIRKIRRDLLKVGFRNF